MKSLQILNGEKCILREQMFASFICLFIKSSMWI